ncbi:MAG: carotenoid oxygenase family protein [Sporichthyaceae bacterium]
MTSTIRLQTAGTRLQGHTSLDTEVRIPELPIRGEFPAWLTGSFMRATPAKFEIGSTSFGHWFDGLGMLNVFTFTGGTVSYANRFLQTPRKADADAGRFRTNVTVNTDPCRRLGKRLMSIFDADAHFEPNINIARFGERYFVATEAPCPIEFDPDTLESKGFADFGHTPRDSHMLYDHMQFDPAPGSEMVTLVTRIGVRNEHRIDAVGRDLTRRRIGSAAASRPAEYMHSFAMTENYVVLPLQPLQYSVPAIVRSGKFSECLIWKPQLGASFVVIDRRTGREVSRHAAKSFFFWHTINAYEQAGEIVLDLVASESPQAVWDLELDKLRDPDHRPAFWGRPRRYRLPLAGGPAIERQIANVRMEFPRINDAHNTKAYSTVYGVAYTSDDSDWFDSIIKTDVDTGATVSWQENGCYPGEPIFVPRPDAGAEDHGVLLSTVLDSHDGRSFLLVLDASDLSEIGRAELPHHLPFNFHAQYYADHRVG